MDEQFSKLYLSYINYLSEGDGKIENFGLTFELVMLRAILMETNIS